MPSSKPRKSTGLVVSGLRVPSSLLLLPLGLQLLLDGDLKKSRNKRDQFERFLRLRSKRKKSDSP